MGDTDQDEATGLTGVPRQVIRSLRLFSAAPSAARTRRPTDLVLLVLALVTMILTAWAVDPPGPLSRDISQFVSDAPDWLASVWQIFFDLLAFWVGILLVLALVRRHFVLVLGALAAAVLALLVGYVAQRLALPEPVSLGDFLRQFTVSEGPAAFPGIRLAFATAVLVTASPSLSRPFRFFGRIVLTLGFLASVGLDVATVAGAIGGLVTGTVGAASIHLALGSPGGRPSIESVAATLANLGIPASSVAPAQLEPAGVALMTATHADGRPLTVKVYGRDAYDSQLITKLWRAAWYRNGRGTFLLSRLHQVEHEALLTVLADRAGTPVPEILVAGETNAGDAALVSTVGGTALADIEDGDEITPSLRELWSVMGLAHDRGIVHGALDLHRVTLDAEGAPLLVDWADGSVAAPPDAVRAEQAQLLVLTALVVGIDRAVPIARDALGCDDLGELVPYLQNPALTSELRRDVHEREFDLDTLRTQAAEQADAEDVELVELRRVTWGSILQLAVVGIAAWLLISSLADIGIDTLVDELSMATWGWVITALIVAQCARFFTAISTTGATDHPLRLGPTVMLEFAITFVNLAIPASAARVATKLRYFQKVGMTLTAATAMGMLDSVAGFTVQILIVVAAVVFGVGGVEFDVDIDQETVQNLVILLLVVGVVLIGAMVAAYHFVPRVHERVSPWLEQARRALAVMRSPNRLLRLFGGNLMSEITFAVVLGLSLRAYGESAPLMSLLVINVAVSMFAGIMPVPGGMGVTEGALTAGLIAIGIPEPTAFAAAITSRLCTFYLPPIWGYFALRWMRTNQYL